MKASAYNAGDPGSVPGSGKVSWRRKWQPTPVFLPGKSHGQEPGRLQSMELQSRTQLSDFTYLLTKHAAAAAAAKSLQSCPTLCDPIDGSPPGFRSLGLSRQEHWNGSPFPSPVHESEK